MTDGRHNSGPVLRIANCSGFYGDRLSAAREMVEGGPIDVLTGDWLAELTMLLLAKSRDRGGPGYARTFLTQLEQVLGSCLERGIRIVSNAGGLDPAGCAAAVRELAGRAGLAPVVAHVEGDDLMPRLAELTAAGHALANTDTGQPLAQAGVVPVTANAYLGGLPVAQALRRGADVVVTGRITDAALVTGPGIWRFGWTGDDLDALAGAVAAGHVIECGCQATGGNYSFFREVPDLAEAGFPIAELAADGSAVITKHPGTGGLVSVGTVTAQLLYEIGGPEYLNPDVTARFDTIVLEQAGPDRVRLSGTAGEPPPAGLKVALNYDGGYRNTMVLVIQGGDVTAKAELAQQAIWARIPGGRSAFGSVSAELHGRDPALLMITAMDADRRLAGRGFSAAVIETALASYPGLFALTPPGDASSFGVYWPTTIPASLVTSRVVIDGEHAWAGPSRAEPAAAHGDADTAYGGTATAEGDGDAADREGDLRAAGPAAWADPAAPSQPAAGRGLDASVTPDGGTVRVPLGTIAGARSGDKGGNANVGVWVRNQAEFAWLVEYLTEQRLAELVPSAAGHRVERYLLPNLLAVNFVIFGLLGRGVAASTRLDPQAKALGEELRAALADIPASLVTSGGEPSG
ncbi:MAG TPA: acyclic terpene utilization AtuA family protein [Streptosporangiaceae bacterium]